MTFHLRAPSRMSSRIPGVALPPYTPRRDARRGRAPTGGYRRAGTRVVLDKRLIQEDRSHPGRSHLDKSLIQGDEVPG